MNYSNLFMVEGLIAGLQIAFVLISIIVSTISLVHALKESSKRALIIVFSSLGLIFGLLGLFFSIIVFSAFRLGYGSLGLLFGLIFTPLGLALAIISMIQDRKTHNYIAFVISIVVITGVIGLGYSYYRYNQVEHVVYYTIPNLGP